jgi:hypothetical protein
MSRIARRFGLRVAENIDLLPLAIFAGSVASGHTAIGVMAAVLVGVLAYVIKHRPIGGSVPHPLSFAAARAAAQARRSPAGDRAQMGPPAAGGMQ